MPTGVRPLVGSNVNEKALACVLRHYGIFHDLTGTGYEGLSREQASQHAPGFR